MTVKSICGIVLASENPKALAEFYSAALGLSFEREEHGGLAEHFGIDLGEVHFGIHPPENLNKGAAGNARMSIAFNVDSFEEAAARVAGVGVKVIAEPHDEGFGMVATYEDPEGNQFEVVELKYEFGS